MQEMKKKNIAESVLRNNIWIFINLHKWCTRISKLDLETGIFSIYFIYLASAFIRI